MIKKKYERWCNYDNKPCETDTPCDQCWVKHNYIERKPKLPKKKTFFEKLKAMFY